MSVWLGILSLSLFSLALVIWAGRRSVSVVRSDPLSFYKAQLKEIESDVKDSMISAEDAETASLEIKRRLIKTSEKSGNAYNDTPNDRLFYTVGAIIIAGAVILYAMLGKPGIPARPAQTPEALDQQISPTNPTTYKEAIATIRARLEAEPDDLEGWKVLGGTLSSLRRHSEAAQAYRTATILSPEDIILHLRLGEQIMAMHDNQVVPAASNAFQAILKLEPNHPGAHFYLGLSQKQAGNNENAKKIWQALIDRSAPDAPWLPGVRQQLAALDAPVKQPSGPSREAIEAAQNMSPEEQAAFINQMVERLRQRLKDNPDNVQGWIRLARSEATRGNKDAAIAALKEGIKSVSKADQEKLKEYLKILEN